MILYMVFYDYIICVYDIELFELFKVFRGYNGFVRTLVTVNDYVFSGLYDRIVCVWFVYIVDVGLFVGMDLVKMLKGYCDVVCVLACFSRR